MKQFLEQEAFALAPGAKPANGDVDQNVGPCVAGSGAMVDMRHDYEYISGLQRKLASLESAPGHDIEAVSGNPLWARRAGQRSPLRHALMVMLGVFALVVAIVSSAVISRVVAKILF